MKNKWRIVVVIACLFAMIVPVARAGYHPPPSGYWKYCGVGVWGWHGASHYTSCPFALNVARGVRSSPEYGAYRLVGRSYSPVTGITYKVNCYRSYPAAYRCTAGISAVIWIGY